MLDDVRLVAGTHPNPDLADNHFHHAHSPGRLVTSTTCIDRPLASSASKAARLRLAHRLPPAYLLRGGAALQNGL